MRSHVETEVICSIPHKITLRASGPEESTAKHPKKGVSYIRFIYFQLLLQHNSIGLFSHEDLMLLLCPF